MFVTKSRSQIRFQSTDHTLSAFLLCFPLIMVVRFKAKSKEMEESGDWRGELLPGSGLTTPASLTLHPSSISSLFADVLGYYNLAFFPNPNQTSNLLESKRERSSVGMLRISRGSNLSLDLEFYRRARGELHEERRGCGCLRSGSQGMSVRMRNDGRDGMQGERGEVVSLLIDPLLFLLDFKRKRRRREQSKKAGERVF